MYEHFLHIEYCYPKFPVGKDKIDLLKTSGFFTYQQVEHSKILHGARLALSILYGSKKRQRLLLYISLTDWFFFINVVGSVYCAVRADSLYKTGYV